MTTTVRSGLLHGFTTLVMDNGLVRTVVIPQLGARVWELEDRVRRRQWVWHREQVPLTACSRDAVYDEVWAGGWEELFPNDAPGRFEGRDLCDHGEWWTARWSATEVVEGSRGKVRDRKSTRLNSSHLG